MWDLKWIANTPRPLRRVNSGCESSQHDTNVILFRDLTKCEAAEGERD